MLTIDQTRTYYHAADAVHDFAHILRVYHMAARLAETEGADLEIVRAAALLHDVPTGGSRTNHHLDSAARAAEILQAEGWDAGRIAAVAHCIRTHRYRDRREPPQTIEAQCLFDADKLDAIGAIGVARALAYATLHDSPFYAEPSQQFLDGGEKTPAELHSAWHEYWFKLRNIQARLYTATGRAIAAQRHATMAAYFVQLQAEMRGEA